VLFRGGWLKPVSSGPVPGNQAIEIVTVRPIGAENVLIEQTLDAAIEADLVGMVLGPHRPTHLPVPTAPQNDHPRTC